MAKRRPKPEIEVTPFTIAVDDREGLPYRFSEILSDSKVPLLVQTNEQRLATGDYSIVGLESEVAIERKSKEDAYRSFTAERRLHIQKLERMATMRFSAVVVECSWHELLFDPPYESRANPKSVFRSILAWMTRYPSHWVLAPNRAFGERLTFRLLERYWKDRHDAADVERG